MSWQFRRRIKIAPGIRLNISKGGISTSFGVRGANITVGKNGTYLNTGIPGTGIYNRSKIGGAYKTTPNTLITPKNTFEDKNQYNGFGIISIIGIVSLIIFNSLGGASKFPIEFIVLAIVGIIGFDLLFTLIVRSDNKRASNLVHLYSSEKNKAMEEIKKTADPLKKEILNAYISCLELSQSANEKEAIIAALNKRIQKRDKQEYREQLTNFESELKELQEKLETVQFDSDKDLPEIQKDTFSTLCKNFENLISSGKIWIISSTVSNFERKSSASTLVNREQVQFFTGIFSFIKSKFEMPILTDLNGNSYYLYPKFLIKATSPTQFEIYSWNKVDVQFSNTRFIENQIIPADSKIVDYYYTYVNKDGSPDRRYAYNPKNPVVIYGEIKILPFNLSYQISNLNYAQEFANEIKKYLSLSNSGIQNKAVSPEFPENFESEKMKYINLTDLDPRFKDIAKFVIENKLITTSQLQRKFSLGYNRAGRIVDQLEQAGIVKSLPGSSAKEVLISDFSKINFDYNNDEHAPSNKEEFSFQFYLLLRDFSPSVSTLLEKLLTAKNIIEYFKSKGIENDWKESIRYALIYDLAKITSYLSDNFLSPEKLETIGLAILSGGLLDEDSNLIKSEFQYLKKASDLGLFKNITLNIQDILKNGNPIKPILQSASLENEELSLPLFLKDLNVDLEDEYGAVLYRFANIISKADGLVTDKEKESLKAVYEWTHRYTTQEEKENIKPIKNIDSQTKQIEDSETLEDSLVNLNSLIGLTEVKQQISSLVNFIKVQKAREIQGLKLASISYHVVFTGNPGTGKTTVARILAKIYKHLGLIQKGQLIETDRSGLVAEYLGQTAVKTNKTIDSALDGVLFIDEAYSLIGKNGDDYGREAVATLIKRMEDNRDRLIVILAGYTTEMEDFISTNPGFKSRFNRFINFPDYTAEELYEIFEFNCSKSNYELTDAAREKVKSIFSEAILKKEKNFGNGRFARNIFEKTLENQANRIAEEPNLTKGILVTIIERDIPQ